MVADQVITARGESPLSLVELWVVFHKISSMIIYIIVAIFTASVVTVLLLRNRKDQ